MSTIDELIRLFDGINETVEVDRLQSLLLPYRLQLRDEAGTRALYSQNVAFWTSLGRVWKMYMLLIEENMNQPESNKRKDICEGAQILGRFLIGLCSGDDSNENQIQAMEHVVPSIQKILLGLSSYYHLLDPHFLNLTKTLLQGLSNCITSNSQVQDHYNQQYIVQSHDNIFLRLLSCQNAGAIQILLILMINLVSNSPERAESFATCSNGIAVMDRLLTTAAKLFDGEEGKQEAPEIDLFSLIYAFVRQFITLGVFHETYDAQYIVSSDSPIISTTQFILLKFLDSFLAEASDGGVFGLKIIHFLYALLDDFCGDLLGDDASTKNLDGDKAMSFQGAILVLQCLSSIGLHSERESQGPASRQPPPQEIVVVICRLLNFVNDIGVKYRPQTATSYARDLESPTNEEPPLIGMAKLCCVRLLGIIALDSTQVQNQVREAGGLIDVLNLARIDPTNRTLREHAIFTIRILLKNNGENQAFVESLKPQFLMGPDGAIRELPEELRSRG